MIGTRKPITLIDESPSLVNGEWEPNSETILESWADVEQKTGFRDTNLNQTQIGRFYEFRFRFRGDITINAHCRIIYDGKKRTIHSVEKENEKPFYWILRVESKSFE